MAKPTIIHVYRQRIASNLKHGTDEPVIIVREGRKRSYHHKVHIEGPCDIVYNSEKPLSCGARCWIETTSKVTGVD